MSFFADNTEKKAGVARCVALVLVVLGLMAVVVCWGCADHVENTGTGTGDKPIGEDPANIDPTPAPSDPLDEAREIIAQLRPHTYYCLCNAKSALVMEAEGDDVPAGATVLMREKAFSTNQYFTLWLQDDGTYVIHNYATFSVVLAAHLEDDKLTVERTDDESLFQRWILIPEEEGNVRIANASDQSLYLMTEVVEGESVLRVARSDVADFVEASLWNLDCVVDLEKAGVLTVGMTKNYTGEELEPTVTAFFLKYQLVAEEDYTVLYNGKTDKPKNVGTYKVTIQGIAPAFNTKYVGNFTIVSGANALQKDAICNINLPVVDEEGNKIMIGGKDTFQSLSTEVVLKPTGYYSFRNSEREILSVPMAYNLMPELNYGNPATITRNNPSRTITGSSSIVCIGDSVLNGYTPTGSCADWGAVLSSYFGAQSYGYGEGGLGYAATGQRGNTLIDYLNMILTERGDQVDMVVLGLGINDTRSYCTYNEVYSAVTLALHLIRSYWGEIPVFFFTNIWYDRDYDLFSNGDEIATAVEDAVALSPYNENTYVNSQCWQWLLGNDEVICTDGIHPYLEGQKIIGERMLQSILSQRVMDWVYVPDDEGFILRCAYDTDVALAFTLDGELTLVRR